MRRVLNSLGLYDGPGDERPGVPDHFKRDYDAMNEVYAGYFPEGARPTRTCVGVTDLVRDALIEIDCIAKK